VTPAPHILGEVLFDCFPDGRRVLGGAPFNVAWHLAGFGLAPLFLSAVGDDDDGKKFSRGCVRARHPGRWSATPRASRNGRVDVCDADTAPDYRFPERSAWDAFSLAGIPGDTPPSILYQACVSPRGFAGLPSDSGKRRALSRIQSLKTKQPRSHGNAVVV
jgi:fructokinase